MTRRQALYKLMSNQSNRAYPKILPYSLSKYNTAAHVGRLEHNLTFVHHVGVSNGNQHLPTASRLPSEQITHFYLSLSFFFPSFLNLSSYFSSSSPLIFFFHPSSLPSQLLSSISLPCHSPSLFVLCVHVWPSPSGPPLAWIPKDWVYRPRHYSPFHLGVFLNCAFWFGQLLFICVSAHAPNPL